MPQKKNINIEEKVKMVRMYRAGKVSLNGLAQILGVNWYIAVVWVRNYEAEGPGRRFGRGLRYILHMETSNP